MELQAKLHHTNGVIRRQSKMDEKTVQAREHFDKAERKTKRRWKKGWTKPNLIKAAHTFTEAGLLYLQTQDLEMAKKCLYRAYECYKSKRAWYEAGKTLEQIVKIAQECKANNIEEIAMEAANAYDAACQPDLAAQLLERVANDIKDSKPNSTEALLEKASSILETESRPIQAAFFVNKIVQQKMQRGEIEKCVDHVRRLIRLYLEAQHKPSAGRSILSLTLILVSLERISEADKVSREFHGQCNDDQIGLIDTLLKGCEKSDGNMVKTALENPCFSCLKSDYKDVFDKVEKAYMPNLEVDEDEKRKSSAVAIQTSIENVRKMTPEHSLDLETKRFKPPPLERSKTLPTFDATELEKNRLVNLHPANMAAVYGDVTGFDPMEPRFVGMTIDQWREFKKYNLENNSTIDEYEFDHFDEE